MKTKLESPGFYCQSFRTTDQRPLQDQLKDLITMANKAGMYDAADWIRDRMTARTRR